MRLAVRDLQLMFLGWGDPRADLYALKKRKQTLVPAGYGTMIRRLSGRSLVIMHTTL